MCGLVVAEMLEAQQTESADRFAICIRSCLSYDHRASKIDALQGANQQITCTLTPNSTTTNQCKIHPLVKRIPLALAKGLITYSLGSQTSTAEGSAGTSDLAGHAAKIEL